jgi:hypothetical protein
MNATMLKAAIAFVPASLIFVGAVIAASFFSACAPTPMSQSLVSLVTSLTGNDGSIGTEHPGTMPRFSDGPTIVATVSTDMVVAGGSNTLELQSREPFQTVYMSVTGLDGFFDLHLSSATSDATVTLSIASGVPSGAFQGVWTVASPYGLVGNPLTDLWGIH